MGVKSHRALAGAEVSPVRALPSLTLRTGVRRVGGVGFRWPPLGGDRLSGIAVQRCAQGATHRFSCGVAPGDARASWAQPVIPLGNTKPEFQAAALTWGWPKWADLFSISSLTFVLISPGSSPSLPDLKKGRGRRCRLPRAPERARLSSPVQASPRLRAGDWGSPKPRSKDALFVWNGLLKTRTHTITKPVWFREAVRGSHDPV